MFCVDDWANLLCPEDLESLQFRNSPGCIVKKVADILLVAKYGGCSDMFPEQLGGLTVLFESFQEMSICLTCITRLAAWTQHFVNDMALEGLVN